MLLKPMDALPASWAVAKADHVSVSRKSVGSNRTNPTATYLLS
jgi:hypothetical protein